MKKLVLVLVGVILTSCTTNYLEKKYDTSSNSDNLKEISNLIPEADFKILKDYIADSESKYINLGENTYQNLLLKAQETYREKELLKKEAEEKEKLTTFLCTEEWTQEDYAIQIKIPSDSEENVNNAKELLNMGIIGFKGVELIYSVEKNVYGTFLKAKLGGGFEKTYSGKNRSFKKYYPDGTFINYFKNDSLNAYKGSWEFTDTNYISESQPERLIGRFRKKNMYHKIILLDEKTFLFYNDFDKDIITSIKMVHQIKE